MSGSASRTTSPSSFSRTRSTPCVLGCWGPMLSSIQSVGGSCSGPNGSCPGPGPNGSWAGPGPNGSCATRVSATDRVGLQPFKLLVAEDDRLTEGDVILPQRMAFPALRHQQPAQVRMTVELDPEQVPGFTLVPVCRGPDGRQAGRVRIGHRRRRLDADTGFLGQRANLPDDGKAGRARRPVDRRRVEEVVKAFLLLQVARDLDDRLRPDHDAQVAAEIRALLQGPGKPTAYALHERVANTQRAPFLLRRTG